MLLSVILAISLPVPEAAAQTNNDTVWVEDALPAGATPAADGGDSWNWSNNSPLPYSGTLAHQSAVAGGEHQHYFYNAAAMLSVGVGESLFSYVYLDPTNPPSEVMLQWNDGSWEHRAYWGTNLIPWGNDGTVSRHAMGALPAAGQWVRLEVAAIAVGLEGHILNGMAFTLADGRATWDYAGKSSTAGPAGQSISFNAPGNRALGAPPLALSATASSGLPVSFTSLTSAVCTVSGNTVTLVALGTCTIRAAQAGNANFAAAANVNQSFQVTAVTGNDTVWVEDALPAGATPAADGGDSWNWISSNPLPYSGTLAHQAVVAGGEHQHYFYNAAATLSVGVGETLFSYVYLDPAHPPSEVMLQWNDGSWEHRAYWGANLIPWGNDGTVSRHAMGSLPAAGQWVRLEVAASVVGLEGHVLNGMAFTLADGRATWDYAGKSSTAGPAGQSISFNAPGNQSLGAPPFALSATASSGLPVTFASLTSAVCTVSGSMVTLVSAGTCTIQASQAGNPSYAAAPNVTQSFNVTSLTAQTIAFAALVNHTLGAAPFTVMASATSGLPVSFFSLAVPVCTLSGSTVTLITVGTCTIRASQAGNTTYAVAPNIDQSFQVTSNTGPAPPDLVLTPTLTYAVGSVPKAFAVADFNGDGKPDMAVINESTGTVSILLGGGNGTFAAATMLVTGAVPTQIVAGDFNGDGKSDLAVTNLLNNSVWGFLGNGDGTFQFPTTIGVGAPAYGLAASDLNGDGKLDLVVTNAAGGATGHTLQVLLGKGDGTFQPAVAYATASDPFAVAIGDVNRDGLLDLVVANNSSHDFSTLLGNGGGTFQPAMTMPVGPLTGPSAIVTGDFNGDGKLDVAIVDSQANAVSVFLGRGDGTFAFGSTLATGSGPVGISIADFNGDGQPDLAVSNKFDSNLSVFLGKGDGTFQPPVLLSLGSAPSPIASSDFYGNGKPDLVIGNAFASSITIIRNETSMPGALVTLGGTPQSAPANTAYPIALSAGVRDAANNPLSGRVVTFVAPSSGASGMFAGDVQGAHAVSDANGVATAPTFTANGTGGAFSVLAGVASLSTSFRLTNEASATQAPIFTSAPPPNGFLNGPYSYLLTAAGAPPPTFSMVASALPPGLALNSTSGLINGTPTTPGTFAGTLKASNGTLPDATQNFAITIAGTAQTISFLPLSNTTFGAAPFGASATASSGLPVIFASLTTPVCTVSGTTVTIAAAGACTIQASQAGNATFAPAPNVGQAFVVAQAGQSITFSALGNQTLGAAPFAVIATASSGLAVSFSSLTSAMCTASGNTVTLVAIGTCTIRVAQAGNGNYSAAPNVDQSFIVTNAADISFAPQVQYATGSYPDFVAIGDFNGDGKLDVAVVNEIGGTVSIFLGNGDGALQTATTLSGAGGFAAHAVVGDFNGDGSLDLAVTSILDNVVALYLGNGDGTFRTRTTVAAGTAPSGIAAADFNGDGKLDLVVANGSSGATTGHTITVLPGNGNGTFQSATAYTVGTNPRDVAVGDFNGDGKLDLAVTNYDTNTTSILLGNGDGTFGASVSFATGFHPSSVAVGDFNSDGHLDLAMVISFGVSIVLGHGDGTFGPPANINLGSAPSGIAIADFNGDGKLDLAVANAFVGQTFDNHVNVLLGNGDGTFQPPRIFGVGTEPVSVAGGDFNGDGKPDLVVANFQSNTASVLLNTSTTNPVATVAAQSGTPQSAPSNTAYVTALTAVVRDAGNHPLPGVAVTFTAPASGASAAFAGGARTVQMVTDATGTATAPRLTANVTAGAFTVVARVGALSATFSLTNVTGSVAPIFTSGAPPNGTYNAPYSYALTATGSPVPTFAVSSGALPSGLALNGTTGIILGTPTAAGSFSGVITATNGVAPAANQAFAITINLPNTAPLFTSGAPPNGMYRVAYTFAVRASGAPAPTFTVASGSLPPGLTLNVGTGIISGMPSALGPFFGVINAANGINPSASQGFVITIAAESQTITFASLGNQMLGAAPVPVSASASSGLVVAFSSLTPSVCKVTSTVSGTTAAFFAIGTCTLRASQGGNANYSAAPSVDQSFAITLASQTIAFSALSDEPFGTVPFTLHATASSGLTVAFASLTTTVCAVNGTTVTLVSHGTCTIRASQAGDATHSAAPNIDQSFAVTVANQTITFVIITPPTTSLPSSDYMHVIGAKASSGLPVSFTSLTPTVCRIDVNLMLLLRVGTCTVRASQAGGSDYSAAPNVDQSFPVTEATQWLSFWRPEDRSITMSQVQLSATAASGLPVSFSSRTPEVCTVNGNIATLIGSYLGSATCTIDASVPGNVNLLPAIASQSFRVFGVFDYHVPPTLFTAPLLEYSTYLGSSNYDTAFDVVVGPDGSAYVGGSVARANFPGLSSATFSNGGLDLLYVTKIGANNANLNFATVVGGRAPDITNTGRSAYVGALQPRPGSILGGGQVEAMAKDFAGNVYVAAYANSTQFPVSGGTYSRAGPKYIFKVGPSGAVQPISAAIDPAVSTIRALAVDSNGSVYFTGVAAPGLITGPSAVIPSVPTGTVVAPYLIKLAPGGATTVFATYLSIHGSRPGTRRPADVAGFPIDSETTAYALTVDASGNSYLAGQANADDFPVTPGSAAGHSYDTQFRDAFVAKLNPTGTAFVFVARLDGGRNDEDRATSIALAPDGGIVIGGKSASEPLYGFGTAFQDQVVLPPHPDSDREIGFIAKLLSDGSDWQFVAPIGAHGGNLVGRVSFSISDPRPIKVGVDGTGAIYAAGTAFTADSLPVLSNIPGVTPGGAFIMKLSPDGSRQIYSTTLGSGVATGLALDAFGNAYVTGYNSYFTSPNQMPALINGEVISSGDYDVSSVFITKINDQVAPLTMATDHNPGTAGQPLNLVARLGDSRYAGTIEFRNGSQVVGTVATGAGSATLPLTFAAGIYRLSAVFHGSGPFDGIAAPELVQVMNQAAP